MTKTIKKRDGYILYRPANTQDMNYTLVGEETGTRWLIDICDVADYEREFDDWSILWSDLKSLKDIDLVKSSAWKVIEL